jgi:Thrombospondin type 1 domain/WW domain/Gametolysin peptidase M11
MMGTSHVHMYYAALYFFSHSFVVFGIPPTPPPTHPRRFFPNICFRVLSSTHITNSDYTSLYHYMYLQLVVPGLLMMMSCTLLHLFTHILFSLYSAYVSLFFFFFFFFWFLYLPLSPNKQYTSHAIASQDIPDDAHKFGPLDVQLIGGLPAALADGEDEPDMFEVHAAASHGAIHGYAGTDEDGHMYAFELDFMPDEVIAQLRDMDNVEVIATPTLNGNGLRVYAMGILPRVETLADDVEAVYSSGSTLTLEGLYVLANFDNGASASVCTKASLINLVFDTSQQYNVIEGYESISHGRRLMGTSSDYSSRYIAGPYDFADLSKDSECTYSTWVNRIAEVARANGKDMTKFGTIVAVIPIPSNCGWAGLATRSTSCVPSSSRSTKPRCFSIMARCSHMVFMHELGHNIGFSHSGTDVSDTGVVPTSAQYTDHSCFMGNRGSWTAVNSVKAVKYGWLDADKVIEDSLGTYTLSSLDLKTSVAPHTQVIRLRAADASPARYYYVSLRTKTRYAYNLQTRYVGVNVHNLPDGSSFSGFMVNLDTVGEEVSLKGLNYKIRLESIDLDGHKAVVKVCGTNGCDINHRWEEGAFGACSVSCGSGQQTRPVVCRQLNPSAVVADSECTNNVGPKPTTTRICNTFKCNPCGDLECNNGTCQDLGEGRAQCKCDDGYFGDDCATTGWINNVVLSFSSSTKRYSITWDSSSGLDQVTITLASLENTLPILIARSVSNSFSYSFNVDKFGTRGSGRYYVRVAFTSFISGKSTPIALDLCDALNCGSNGNCAFGKCMCDTNYEGRVCETFNDPCSGVNCMNGGTCDSNTGRCDCSNTNHASTGTPYSGPRCSIAPDCPVVCSNGGTQKSDCSNCTCVGEWDGASCTLCDRICRFGAANGACDDCTCPLPYIGDRCDRVYRVMTIGPFKSIAAGHTADPTRRAELEQSIRADLTQVISVGASRIKFGSAYDGPGGAYFNIYLISKHLDDYIIDIPPPSVNDGDNDELIMSLDSYADLSSDASKFQLQDARDVQLFALAIADIKTHESTIESQMQQSDSALYQGSVFSSLSYSEATFSAGAPPDATTTTSEVGLIVGIMVGIMAVFALGVVIYVKRNPRQRGANLHGEGHSSSTRNVRRDSFMHAPKVDAAELSVSLSPQGPATTATTNWGGKQRPVPSLPPRAAPGEPTLPAGWQRYYTDDGIPYYYNEDTQQSSWEVPV